MEKSEYEKIPVPFKIGKKYIFRAVTYHMIGEVKDIIGKFLVIKDACWLADTGIRWHDVLKDDNLAKTDKAELEPFIKDAYLAIEAIVDATEITIKLPLRQR